MFQAITSQIRPVVGTARSLDREQRYLALAGGGSLLVAFALFLTLPDLVVFPTAVFVLTVLYGWHAHEAETAKSLMFLATVLTGVILLLITSFLFRQSYPVFSEMGLDLLLGTSDPLWDTSGDVYKLLPMMWGTVVTTVIAMLVAAPFGVGGAIYISEVAPRTVREIVKPAIEILAGIPSIVYGFIGFVILNDYMQDVFAVSGYGSFVVAGGMIGLMALPTVASVAEDALSSVPNHMKDGALAMGATEWQTIKSVTLPASISGVSAAVLLGVGRAVGETMAATVILGNVVRFPEPLYDVFGNGITLTSLIASQYGNATNMHLWALFAAGVVLFVTVMILSLAAHVIEQRMKRRLEGHQ